MLADLREEKLSVGEVVAHVSHASVGGVAVFIGLVRSENDGHAVTLLEYQAYASMARAELARIVEELVAETPGIELAILHRVGALSVGDLAVVGAASAPHRDEAFSACRALIDRVKARVPIWKREHGPSGPTWVGWVDARSGPEPGHAPAGSRDA